MNWFDDWDLATPPETVLERLVREAVTRIHQQLADSEWVIEHSADACYKYFSRGNLRVTLTIRPQMLSFESLKTQTHLMVQMPVDYRKELYAAFMAYSPKEPSVEIKRRAELSEWLSCVDENRFGREVERKL